jgi:hypothetical protein
MAAQVDISLNKLARLREEQKIQMGVLPLDPAFPFFVVGFDPGFFRAESSLPQDQEHED